MNQILNPNSNQNDKNKKDKHNKGYNNRNNAFNPNMNSNSYYNGYNGYNSQFEPAYGDNRYNNDGKMTKQKNIKNIIRIYAVLVFVLGIFLLSKNTIELVTNKNNITDNPIVNIEQVGKEAIIDVTTSLPPREIYYKWGNGQENHFDLDGTVNAKKTINIPVGNNVLNVTVIDASGNKKDYVKQFLYESEDQEKPVIKYEKVGTKLKITATDNTEMGYLAYKWNDKPFVRVDLDKSSEQKNIITATVDVPKSKNTLTVQAVDKYENKTEEEKTIIGVNAPTINMFLNGEKLVIQVRDDIGLESLIVKVDSNEMDTADALKNMKEREVSIDLQKGTHTITAVLTNTTGLQTEKTMTVTV